MPGERNDYPMPTINQLVRKPRRVQVMPADVDQVKAYIVAHAPLLPS